MTSPAADDPHVAVLNRLADGQELPLDEAREYLGGLAASLRSCEIAEVPETALAVIDRLAESQQSKVRQAAAELLTYLPDQTFARLATLLKSDPNLYVQSAAKRCMTKRLKAERASRKAAIGHAEMGKEYQALVRRLGAEGEASALDYANRRFGHLTASLAHDLRTLLTIQQGRVASVRGIHGDPETEALLDSLDGGIEFMAGYIAAITDYAQARPVEFHTERADDLVSVAVHRAQHHLESIGLSAAGVEISMDRLLPVKVEVSRELIVQALANLITNAMEAMIATDQSVASGRLDVSALQQRGKVVITITDSGCGIGEKHLAALKTFMPGQRNRLKKRRMGLGLLIAKRNVDVHGGDLDIQSEPGGGTTATITLPLRQETRA